jgi:FADH2 O2-dependent halogenase
MTRLSADVAILGAGFGGSLLAQVLIKAGLAPALIDRHKHPRFAIGESATPVADLVLRDLSERYGLPRLAPLTKYGTWNAAYPNIVHGLKRGFSYFRHLPGRTFPVTEGHDHEMLVAASPNDEESDTHWLRSDVDRFLMKEAVALGAPYFDETEMSLAPCGDGWRLSGRRGDEAIEIEAAFLVDASGEGAAIARSLGLPRGAGRLLTNARSIYAHFENLRPFDDVLARLGAVRDDFPFPCDRAALHQVIDEGWMWQLGFDNGVTSAGFMIDAVKHPLDPSVPIEAEWSRLMERYPSLAAQFAPAKIVAPEGGLRRTDRIQRYSPVVVGENWAMLPHTAGFIDPLHSTGIAQTLCGLERLAMILEKNWRLPSLAGELKRYEQILHQEFALADKLVTLCYLARGDFRLFTHAAMPYFAAAHTYEQRRKAGAIAPGAAFLGADNVDLVRAVNSIWRELRAIVGDGVSGPVDDSRALTFQRHVAAQIAPYNTCGLCNPECKNMYRHTAFTWS